MSLTSEQIQQMNQITGMDKPVTPAAQAASSRVAQLQKIAQGPQKPPSLISHTADIIGRTAQDVKANVQEGAAALGRVHSGEESPLTAAPTIAKDITGSIVAPFGEALKGAGTGADGTLNPLGQVKKGVENVIGFIGDKIGDQKATQDFAAFLDRNPHIGQVVNDLYETGMNTAGMVAGPETAETAGAGVSKVGNTMSAAADRIKNAVTPLAETPEVSAARQASDAAARKAVVDKERAKVATKWKAPAIVGKSNAPGSFNKAREILANDPKIPDTLADLNLHPDWYIGENNRFDTMDIAESIRGDIQRMSEEGVTPHVEDISRDTPKMTVDDIESAARADVRRSPELTPGQRKSVNEKITDEIDALRQENPDGLTTEAQHDFKKRYAGSGGYKPNGTVADNMTAAMNRSFGDVLRKSVAGSAPLVDKFNEVATAMNRAADYLEALNGKKAPESFIGSSGRKLIQLTGGVAGHALTGGIYGSVAGYAIGGSIDRMLSSLPKSMSGRFLRNLEKNNPAAYKAILKANKVAQEERASRALLGPGKDQGLNEGRPVVSVPPGSSEYIGKDVSTGKYTPPNAAPGTATPPKPNLYNEDYTEGKNIKFKR